MAPTMQARAIRVLQLAVEEMRSVGSSDDFLSAQSLLTPRALQEPQAHQATPVHHATPAIPVIEQFHRYRPFTLDSGNDPLAAEEWLWTMKFFFSTLLVLKFRKYFVRSSC
ncbi:Uncharacterized protein Adt_18793 [Abeliophyllum distichum]|uniref:Uncharacterized protein n=1 Tax=Abeliophyllum distichum TaxID=126358 RepID=A0ABD1TKD7_9LAMI